MPGERARKSIRIAPRISGKRKRPAAKAGAFLAIFTARLKPGPRYEPSGVPQSHRFLGVAQEDRASERRCGTSKLVP
jgi:hypothetical protein